MTGRVWLLIGVTCGVMAAGEAEDDITAVVSTLASALSDNNPLLFLKSLDKAMPDYGKIERDVNALAVDTQISCSVDVIAVRGNEADLDWYMVLRSQQDQNLIERRRTKVTIKAERRGKKWVVTAFSPVSVFAPLKMR
jgi:hypothetical protein